MTHIDLSDLDNFKPGQIVIADLEQMKRETQGPSKQGLARELATLNKLMEVYERKLQEAGTAKWFVPGTPFSIDNCPRHKAFFEAGATYSERLFLAGNRVGKTVSGALESSFHATGDYPDWWKGRRFDEPTHGWAIGKTGQTTRDTVQKELMGQLGRLGTGTIPKDRIISVTTKQGIAGGYDIVQVRHRSGGVSTIGFKSYDQDLSAFVGTAKHWVWLDEESPEMIYNECLIRTMTTDGITYVTVTPLHGITNFIVNYCKNADFVAGAKPVTVNVVDDPDEVKTFGSATEQKPSRAVIQAGWDHAPWLTEESKERLEANTPPHLRESRRNGTPSIGSGNVYPLALEQIVVDDFDVPETWPRLYALDVGWNRTAAIWLAINPNTKEMFAYSEHYLGREEPEIHASAILNRGKGIPGVIDPASRGRSQIDGRKLIQIYRNMGLSLTEAQNAVEAGIQAVWSALSTGKLKIFKSLVNLQKEYFVYRRDLNGKIIKENDHLMDALRYAVVMAHRAQAQVRIQRTGGTGIGSGIRYDL